LDRRAACSGAPEITEGHPQRERRNSDRQTGLGRNPPAVRTKSTGDPGSEAAKAENFSG